VTTMDMKDQDESRNVEDARGSGGGGFQFRPAHGIGLGTVVVALVAGWVFGINPLQVLSLLSGGGAPVVVLRRLAAVSDEALLGVAVESLYGQALLMTHRPLRPADAALLNRAFGELLGRATREGTSER